MQRDAEDPPLCSCIGSEKNGEKSADEGGRRREEVTTTSEIFIDPLIESRRIMLAVIRNNYCHGIATDHGSDACVLAAISDRRKAASIRSGIFRSVVYARDTAHCKLHM